MAERTTFHTSVKTEFKLSSLVYEPLHANGSNFTKWNLDTQTYLNFENIAKALDLEDENPELEYETLPATARWHTLMILQRHINPTLHNQYMHIRDPTLLWAELTTRFRDQDMLYLPQARADWANLCVMDFPNFSAYDEELHRITSKLRTCGDPVYHADMIEKTFSTVPPTRFPLTQNVRTMKIKRYPKLIQQLLLAESQHQTVLRNSEMRPPREVHNTQVGEIKAVEPAHQPRMELANLRQKRRRRMWPKCTPSRLLTDHLKV